MSRTTHAAVGNQNGGVSASRRHPETRWVAATGWHGDLGFVTNRVVRVKPQGGRGANADKYIGSVVATAKRMNVRSGYLSDTAVRHGFSYSKALRWVRFLHAVTLLAEGRRVDDMAWRLGFCDVAGWSRFTKRLLGKSPGQLPALPLAWWVRKAVDDVFFGISASGVRASPRGRKQ